MQRLAILAVAVAASVLPAAVVPAAAPRLPGTIAYSDRVWWPGASDSWEVIVFSAADRKTHVLTKLLPCGDAIEPAWSRRGGMIAFSCGGRIYLIRRDGSDARKLPGGRSGESPSWSPDGRRLALVNRGWIWIAEIQSGRMRKVTRSFGYTTSWSPDGRKLAFDGGGRKKGIWIVGVDGRGLRRLTHEEDAGPAWSPKGRRVAFARPGNGRVYVISEKSGGARAIPGCFGSNPAWSPDSRWIATQVDSLSQGGIWVIPVNGGRARRLVAAGQPDGVSWGR
jgi:Tol biopolymer transport system component